MYANGERFEGVRYAWLNAWKWVDGGSWAHGERYSSRRVFFWRQDWVHGKRHGQGTYTYADGSVYTGQWENDKIHGKVGTRRNRREGSDCLPKLIHPPT